MSSVGVGGHRSGWVGVTEPRVRGQVGPWHGYVGCCWVWMTHLTFCKHSHASTSIFCWNATLETFVLLGRGDQKQNWRIPLLSIGHCLYEGNMARVEGRVKSSRRAGKSETAKPCGVWEGAGGRGEETKVEAALLLLLELFPPATHPFRFRRGTVIYSNCYIKTLNRRVIPTPHSTATAIDGQRRSPWTSSSSAEGSPYNTPLKKPSHEAEDPVEEAGEEAAEQDAEGADLVLFTEGVDSVEEAKLVKKPPNLPV